MGTKQVERGQVGGIGSCLAWRLYVWTHKGVPVLSETLNLKSFICCAGPEDDRAVDFSRMSTVVPSPSRSQSELHDVWALPSNREVRM